MALYWPGAAGMWSKCNRFSNLLVWSVWVSVLQLVLQSHSVIYNYLNGELFLNSC